MTDHLLEARADLHRSTGIYAKIVFVNLVGQGDILTLISVRRG